MEKWARLSTEQKALIFKRMVTIRKFEENAYDLYTRGLLPGTIHSSIGQEAVAVGVCSNLREDDLVLSNHRGHGHCIAKGLSLPEMMAEMLGKRTGLCKGKGGSMHLCDVEKGLMGCNAIVGANLPVAVGIGLAIKLGGTDQVSVCFFGDGAANEGIFHESLNLASIWNLPILFVCENNFYALTTHISDSTAVDHIANRASSYSMPGFVADGMDIEVVYDSAGGAIEKLRIDGRPILIEYETYRFRGHSRGDPDYGPYRSKEELDTWRKKDPLSMFEEKTGLSMEELGEIEEEVDGLINDAIDFALESPYPDPEESLEDVYPS